MATAKTKTTTKHEHKHDETATTPHKLTEGMVKKEDGTIEITVVIPWNVASKAQGEVEEALIKNVQIAGFRKGQAPKNIAKAKLSPDLIKEEVLKKIIGKAYNEAVVKHDLKPIINPEIHIEVFEEGTDVIFTAITCEDPAIDLGKYKEAIQKVTAKSKILIPGKEAQKPTIEEILEPALKEVKLTIPEILVENEVSRLLSQLLDELKKLGLTLDQYLSTAQKDPEQLRLDYKEKAERDLKLEFFLRKVAEVEKVTVEKEDVDKVLSTIPDDKQKMELLKNPYVVAGIIRQQKTLDLLTNL